MYGASHHGWKMDFAKLAKYLRERYGAEKIFYYAGLDAENKKQLKFYEKLQEFDYVLRLVPLKVFADGKKKGDVDSRMTFEMMKLFPEYGEAIVLTGDGDYYWVLEYLLEEKKGLKIISFRNRTARELRKLVGEKFTDLTRLKDLLEWKVDKKAADAFEGSATGIMS